MITLDMVKRGYETGIINLIDSPHDDGVVCKIGDNWFYFGGETAAEMTAKDYRRDIPLEDIVRSVFQVLEDFRKDGDVFEDEYLYYEAFLNEQLKEDPMESVMDAATRLVQENRALAYEVFRIMKREYQREDIIGRIEDHCDVDIDRFTDAEIDSITSRFDKNLSNNAGYWESYWLSADAAIYELLQEKFKDGHSNTDDAPWYSSIDELVETAVENINGIGVCAGSGFYELQDFEVDGERMELVIEICRFEDEKDHHGYFGVYYFAGYYDGDSLLSDWEYTSQLDVVELKDAVSKLANRDFTQDIKKCMGKDSVEAMIGDAKERCVEFVAGATIEQENVKE